MKLQHPAKIGFFSSIFVILMKLSGTCCYHTVAFKNALKLGLIWTSRSYIGGEGAPFSRQIQIKIKRIHVIMISYDWSVADSQLISENCQTALGLWAHHGLISPWPRFYLVYMSVSVITV